MKIGGAEQIFKATLRAQLQLISTTFNLGYFFNRFPTPDKSRPLRFEFTTKTKVKGLLHLLGSFFNFKIPRTINEMPNGARRQLPPVPQFQELPAEAQDLSDGGVPNGAFVDEDELIDEEVDVDDDDIGSFLHKHLISQHT
jgi:hypothetical protein